MLRNMVQMKKRVLPLDIIIMMVLRFQRLKGKMEARQLQVSGRRKALDDEKDITEAERRSPGRR